MEKRALSPVIATVLLIFLVTALATIIFMWGKNFMSEQIEKLEKPAEVICDEIQFDAKISTVGRNLEIANRGNIPLFSFDLKEIKDGNSNVKTLDLSVLAGRSVSQAVPLDINAEEIIIFPKILGNVKGESINKPFTCTNQGQKII